jgi:pimeloyl-[acyl-carrier protein] methyl ester esterase
MSLYTETSGTGPDLVLVHGWGLHGGIWGTFVPLLAANFRVTCVDLPGHGRSDWGGEGTLDAITAALLPVVPAPAIWLGWSLGGLVAARAAQMVPTDVTALVTIASTPCFVRKPGWQRAMLPALLDAFAAELAQDYVRTLNRFLALQVRGSNSYGDVLKTLRALLLAHGEPDAAGLRAGLEVLRTADLRDSLGDIDCPTLLLMGESDTLVPVAAGRAASQLFPDAQLEVIAGAGHAPFIAQPEVVAGLVHDFARKQGGMRG